MALSKSKISYETEYEVLDQALDSPAGLGVPVLSRSEGHAYQNRLNYARQLDRDESLERLTAADPMFGKSVYDVLTTSLKQVEGKWWVYITLRRKPEGIVELPIEETQQ